MLVMISLVYEHHNDDGTVERTTLDIWTIEARNQVAVERVVADHLGPALRRYGRRLAQECVDACHAFDPKRLRIDIEAITISSLADLAAEIDDGRGLPALSERLLRSRGPRAMPRTLGEALEVHGVRMADGRTRRIAAPRPREDAGSDDDRPF